MKLLLAATFALLAVASATDVYTAAYSSSGCSGYTASSKLTLDLCFGTGQDYYAKLTLSESTYSYTMYANSSCSTTYSSASPNPVTGAADGCGNTTVDYSSVSFKVLSGSAYASSATAYWDCTSGACTSSNSAGKRSPVPLPCALSHAFVSAHVSVGILSACLAVMALWIA